MLNLTLCLSAQAFNKKSCESERGNNKQEGSLSLSNSQTQGVKEQHKVTVTKYLHLLQKVLQILLVFGAQKHPAGSAAAWGWCEQHWVGSAAVLCQPEQSHETTASLASAKVSQPGQKEGIMRIRYHG